MVQGHQIHILHAYLLWLEIMRIPSLRGKKALLHYVCWVFSWCGMGEQMVWWWCRNILHVKRDNADVTMRQASGMMQLVSAANASSCVGHAHRSTTRSTLVGGDSSRCAGRWSAAGSVRRRRRPRGSGSRGAEGQCLSGRRGPAGRAATAAGIGSGRGHSRQPQVDRNTYRNEITGAR